MHQILKEVLSSMKYFQHTYPEDACIVVADHQTVLGYLPGETIDVQLKVGTAVEELKGTVTEIALREKRQLRDERGPEKFGVAYVSTASPIYVDGEVIGVISAVVSNEKLESLRTNAAELAAVVEQMTATTDGVAEASNDIARRVEDLARVSENVSRELDKMKTVLDFVQEISSQSHMLGLNAAIESARAGSEGQGFAVIAQEIRKMAQTSKQSVKEIAAELIAIQNAVTSMNDDIQKITGDVEENAAGVEELKAAYDHIAMTASSLAELAH